MAEEKTFIKACGLMGETGTGGNTVAVDVKDGKIIRLRPFHIDEKYKQEECASWEIEARGKILKSGFKTLPSPHSIGYKKRVYSPNRILYPMKRVDWNPNGERYPENRGTSKYVRISWDEAIDIIVSEIKRIKKKYGTTAILSQSDGHGESKIVHPSHGCNNLLLQHLGGYTLQTRNADSWEGSYWGAKHAWGMEPVGQESQLNVVLDVARNTELLLCWGCDPETTTWAFGGQLGTRLNYWYRELGIKSIYINPDLNYGAAIHADKWIPIIPNTDAAMRLAIAYTWIIEDSYDKEYIKTHTFGFEKFVDYVMGKEDGIAKTPKWAEPICGVPSRIIKALAREWASKRTTIEHMLGGGSVRGSYSSEPARLEVLLLAMQGLGKPGVHQLLASVFILIPPPAQVMPNPMVAYRGFESPTEAALIHGKSRKDFKIEWEPPGWTPPPLFTLKDDIAPENSTMPKQFIPKNLIPDAILEPPISWQGTSLWGDTLEDQFVKYTYPAKGCPEIHMIWTDTPCWMTCWVDSNRFVRALRSPKIEFILAQHPWMENDCIFADIILPVNTKFEEDDINVDNMSGVLNVIFPEKKCIEPIGESKSDYEIVCMIAERLGMLDKVTEGKSVEEWIRYGFENSDVSQFISWDKLQEKGYFPIPGIPKSKNTQKDNSDITWTPMMDFYKDPEKFPLKTPSGKVEFYSQNLAKHFPDDKERPPVPHWIPYGESHQESRMHPRAEKYSLLVISNHGRWRVHAQLDDISWFKEISTCKVRGPDGYMYEPIWMNPSDAAKRGIKNGDIVRVYNERGSILAGAYVTERIMPGAISIDHGSRYDPIVPGELDRGGAINTLTPHKTTSKNATGMVCAGFLAEVELADLNELRQKYPEAFKRPYHPAAGLCLDRVLHRDEAR